MVTTPSEGRAGHIVGSVDEQRAQQPAKPLPRRTRIEWNGLCGCREVRVRLAKKRAEDTDAERDPGARSERLIGEVCEPFS